jgi:hypothetical protein
MPRHKITHGDYLEQIAPGSRVILVIGDDDQLPWIRDGSTAQIMVKRETEFAAEWPKHASNNRDTHIWIASTVKATLPPIVSASITHEGTTS